ncbi:MAG: glycosyltransferase family 4 protein [Chloroflexia bacterium]
MVGGQWSVVSGQGPGLPRRRYAGLPVTPHSALRRPAVQVAHLVRAVFPEHGYGGLERAASALTTELRRQGADVTLFSRVRSAECGVRSAGYDDTQHATRDTQYVGVPYSVLPLRPNGIAARVTNYPLFVERMGREVERRARTGGVDVVYAQGLCAWGVRSRGRRRTPRGVAPLVMNPQGLEDFKVRDPLKRLAYAPFRAMYARGARAADRVIATDESLRGEVSRYLRVPPERVVVLPNGVDPAAGAALVSAERQAELRARYALSEGGFLGISVARLEANKGLPYLLRALATLDRAGDWRWVVVGTGRDEAALRGLAGELGIGGRVVFTGAVDDADLHNLYAMADAFAISTLYEGSSLVTLEAMAHGLPVVGTRAGGLPDKVLPGRTGLLVPPGDAPALGEGIARLMADRTAAAEMGRAGAALVEERFTWEKIAARTLRLFEELTLSSRS